PDQLMLFSPASEKSATAAQLLKQLEERAGPAGEVTAASPDYVPPPRRGACPWHEELCGRRHDTCSGARRSRRAASCRCRRAGIQPADTSRARGNRADHAERAV